MSQRIAELHAEIQHLRQKVAEQDEHLKQKDLIIYRQAAIIMELEQEKEQ